MRNLNYLFAANLIIWVLFFAYQFSISRRTATLKREIDIVRAKLESEYPPSK